MASASASRLAVVLASSILFASVFFCAFSAASNAESAFCFAARVCLNNDSLRWLDRSNFFSSKVARFCALVAAACAFLAATVARSALFVAWATSEMHSPGANVILIFCACSTDRNDDTLTALALASAAAVPIFKPITWPHSLSKTDPTPPCPSVAE